MILVHFVYSVLWGTLSLFKGAYMKPIKGLYIYFFALFTAFSGINAGSYDLTSGSPYKSSWPYQASRYLQQNQPQSLNPEAKLFVPKNVSKVPPEARKYTINEAFKAKDTEILERLGFTIGPDNNLWYLATEDWQFVQSRNLITPLSVSENTTHISHRRYYRGVILMK